MATERKAAKIEDGVVTNIIVINGITPKELFDVEIDSGSEVGIGWKYKGGKFTPPKQPKLSAEA